VNKNGIRAFNHKRQVREMDEETPVGFCRKSKKFRNRFEKKLEKKRKGLKYETS